MFSAVDLGPACTLFLLLSFCYCDCTNYLISFFLYYYYYFCCCLSLMMQLTHCLDLRDIFSSSWLCSAFDGCSLLKQLNFLSVTMFLDHRRAQFFSPWIMFVFSTQGAIIDRTQQKVGSLDVNAELVHCGKSITVKNGWPLPALSGALCFKQQEVHCFLELFLLLWKLRGVLRKQNISWKEQ